MSENGVPPSRPGFLRSERGVILGVTATVFTLGLVVAGLICYLLPRTYQASGVIEPLTAPGVSIGATDPETVCAIMTSKACLLQVSDELDLVDRWGVDPESVCEILRRRVSVAVQPNGRLVEVTARLGKPEDARDVAAQIPRTWAERARRQAHAQYTETIERAAAGADNHDWLAKEAADELAASKARAPQDPAEIATLEARLARETGLAAAKRNEALRLTAIRDTLVIPLVVHEDPVTPWVAVAPNVPAFFGRWLTASLVVGLAIALPAAALTYQVKCRRPATPTRALVPAADGSW